MGKITNYMLFLLLFFSSYSIDAQDVSAAERQALIDLYNATNGPNWTNNTNWNTAALVSDWYGVTVVNENVTQIDLYNNNLSGNLPASLGNLTNLTRLSLNQNTLSGTIPPELGNLSNLTVLFLQYNTLSGTIPPELGNLTNLTYLILNQNTLSGTIPPELGNLTNLTRLSLGQNPLSGTIPPELGNLTNLTDLHLTENILSGTIPPELGNLTNLTYLSLGYNTLSGTIPPELGNLTNLTDLSLDGNTLSGTIPPELGNLTNLTVLYLYNNTLSGTIPPELGNLTNLTQLYLHNNNLSSGIPNFTTISSLFRLAYPGNLFVFSDFESEHASYVANLSTYTFSPQAKVDQEETLSVLEGGSITLTSTALTSTNNSYQWYKDGVAISGATSKDYIITNATTADAGLYYFEATNSIVTGLTLTRNNVTLTLDPCEISESEKQALLDLYNNTNGANWTNTLASDQPWDTNIPVCDWYGVTVEDGKVTAISISNNSLSGSIPNTIDALVSLTALDLRNNSISGTIPSSLGTLLELESLLLANNNFTGGLPTTLGSLSNLTLLDLSNNNLQGQIPSSFCNLANVTELNLSNNQLMGSLPLQLGLMRSLVRLDLRNNELEGTISNQITNLYYLEFLGLSNNNFSGAIPINVPLGSNLEEFVFENNKFIFSDFESAHPSYAANLDVGYTYVPQAKTDMAEIKTVTANNAITLTTQLSSSNNSYQWFKDGVAIEGATEREYTIDNAAESDAGVYHFTATNGIITDLTLERNPITLEVVQTCDVAAAERQALIDLYNALGGANWNNTLAGNQPWLVNDVDSSVCDWYGVVVEDNTVVALNLGVNALTGTLPDVFVGLPALRTIGFNNNGLRGKVPASIAAITGLEVLAIENNNFVFTDVETEFSTYQAKLGTSFTYNLQAKVDTEIIQTVSETGTVTLTSTALVSANNSYQWYKGGIPIAGATAKEYTLTNITVEDAGEYYFEATNSVVTGLTLTRNSINLDVLPEDDTCGVSTAEKQALLDLYNSTDGANWTNILAGNQPWDINIPVCDWFGVTVVGGEVTKLELAGNNLLGTIPSSLGNLTSLTIMSLAQNSLSGTIPPEVGNLTNLVTLNFSYNHLVGPIPDSVGNLTKLQSFYASINRLESIPSTIGNMTSLVNLSLHGNNISSPIPIEIGQLSNLQRLYLGSNNIPGPIPVEIQNLNSLVAVQLDDNQLSGVLPPELGNMQSLQAFSVSNNDLTGSIPASYGNWNLLRSVGLWKNSFTGAFPIEWSSLTNLNVLNFHTNNFIFSDFEDNHPSYSNNATLTLYAYSPQAKVDLEETQNVLTGAAVTFTSVVLTSPNNSYQWYKDGIAIAGATTKDLVISNVTESDAGVYHFTATNSIVTGLTLERNPITLNVGVAGNCDVSETDRQTLIDFYNATNGDSWTNTLGGNQPWLVNDPTSSICDWFGVTVNTASKIIGIQLPNNNLRGEIPTFIENLQDLKTLDLSENVLVGSIPETIGNLAALQTLNLSTNSLAGKIPTTIGGLQQLVNLDLSANNLCCVIPEGLYTIGTLQSVKLHDNKLVGTISATIGNLTQLQEFWLSNNSFSGTIPTTITNIPVLRSVHLDNNSFKGDIPLLVPDFSVPNTEVKINNNRFVFSDFEAEYPNYSTQLDVFTYDPQAKVDASQTISVLDGDAVTLGTIALTSPNNSYIWYKDGVVIPGATSSSYTISNFDPATDTGTYHFIATNSTIANLELQRNPIQLIELIIPPVIDLTLEALCSTDPGTIREWRVNNPNAISIDVTWQIIGTSQSGTFTIGTGTQLLTTNTEAGDNTLELKWLNEDAIEQGTQAVSSDVFCNPPEDCTNALANEGIVDGSFETVTTASGNGRNGNLDGSGWSISEGTPDAFILPYSNDADPYLLSIVNVSPNGGICVGALRDKNTSEAFGTTVSGLTAGVIYIVEFYQSNATNLLVPELHEEAQGYWQVTLGATTVNSDAMVANSGYTTWQRQKLEFTAAGGTQQLEFKAGSTATNVTNAYPVYTLVDGIRIYPKTTDPYATECADINTQVFCNSDDENQPTISDLVAPEGGNVIWFSQQTGGERYFNDKALNEISGSFVWADDSSGNVRVPVEIVFDLGAPNGLEAQSFDSIDSPTLADIQVEGTNITWHGSYTSANALSSNTPLVNNAVYYAANGGNLCRLAVTVSVGVPNPIGNEFQEFCGTDEPTINNLVMDITHPNYTVVFYSDATGGNLYNTTDALVDGATYYAVQTDGVNYGEERIPVKVSVINVESDAILYERDITIEEGYTLTDLTEFFKLDTGIQWFDVAQGGTAYSNGYQVLDGETYYARFGQGICSSLEVLAVTVNIAEIAQPELVSCIKFIPQPGAEYIISGWVREEELVAEPAGTKDFNDDATARASFTRILQKIADKILDKQEIPETFMVDSFFKEDLNSDVLLPYIKNFTGNKVTVYGFKMEKENVDGVLKTIGFSFSLDPDRNYTFVYKTPNVEWALSVLGSAIYTVESAYHYPLLNYSYLSLTFKDVKVENGNFQIFSNFTIDGNDEAFNQVRSNKYVKYFQNNLLSEGSTLSGIEGTIQLFDYSENPDYQVMDYVNGVIELSYKDINENNIVLGNAVFEPKGAIIDGWQRISTSFQIPVNAAYMKVSLKNLGDGLNAYFDDVRMHPFNSNIKSFVYDPVTQRLQAELDENNYATFYEYDTEGGLVRVKKETERGVYTIQETRSGNSKLNQ